MDEKKISIIQDAEKEYTFLMVLGANTASHDLETAIVPRDNFQFPDSQKIHQIANSFVGIQLQTPPCILLLKSGEKRACALARTRKGSGD